MAVCTPVSRESVLTNWSLMPADMVQGLNTLIVGPDYAVRKPDPTVGTGLIGQYVPATGTVGPWPGLVSGETVDLVSAKLFIIDAAVRFYSEAIATPTLSQGIAFGGAPTNRIRHNGGATVWTGSGFSPFLNVQLAVGDVVRLDNGTGGTVFYSRVTGFESSNTVLVLADTLPAALVGVATYFNVSVAQVVPSVGLVGLDVTLTASTAQANPAILTSTSRTVTAYPVVQWFESSGAQLSRVFADYRALRVANVAAVQSLSLDSQLTSYFIGSQYPEAGLGYAVRQALAPVVSGITPPVIRFNAVATDDSAGWTAAIGRIQRRRDWYGFVPLTSDETTIIPLLRTMMAWRETHSLQSEMFFSVPVATFTTLVSGPGNTVTVDQSLTPGQNRTVTRVGGVTNPFAGVIPGDIVSIAGVEYVVATFVSNQVVTLVSSASPGVGLVLNYVRHPMTTQEQANAFAVKLATYDKRYLTVLFPDTAVNAGIPVSGQYLAAAVGGIRGYAAPQQGLRGVALAASWTVPKSEFTFVAQLDQLAAAGAFVVGVLEDTSTAVVEAANTTDPSALIDFREGLVANVNAITRFYSAQLACFEGRRKVTAATIAEITSKATSLTQYLLSNGILPVIGPIMVDGSVGTVRQDPLQADTIVVPISVVIAAGLERVSLQLDVSIFNVT